MALLASKLGYALQPKGLGYFSPEDIVAKARANNQTVCEYLESNDVAKVGVRRDNIIQRLFVEAVLRPCDRVLEIGAGTGMYLEKTIEHCSPARYEVYETAPGWVEYLRSEFGAKTGLVCHLADGRTLKETPSDSIDISLAHAVFVYLPVITTFGYLSECVRVCKPGGQIVFDCFTDRNFGLNVVERWKSNEFGFNFPVVLPSKLIDEFARFNGLSLLDEFNIQYHCSETTYYVFQKNEGGLI